MGNYGILKIFHPGGFGEGTVQSSYDIGLTLLVICPGKPIPSKTKVLKIRSCDHVIEVLKRWGRRRTDTEFLRMQENGVKISNHTPKERVVEV